MLTQKCPRCGSKKVKRGYRPTPLLKKLIFRFNLLCDGCNWEFTGFAVPGIAANKNGGKRKNDSFKLPDLVVEDKNENKDFLPAPESGELSPKANEPPPQPPKQHKKRQRQQQKKKTSKKN